jgi:hypothetical protein
MMKKTAVSARVRLLPAIAALCVTGVVSAHAENAPATTPAATAAQGAQPTTTPATPPAAPAKVEDPSAKLTACYGHACCDHVSRHRGDDTGSPGCNSARGHCCDHASGCPGSARGHGRDDASCRCGFACGYRRHHASCRSGRDTAGRCRCTSCSFRCRTQFHRRAARSRHRDCRATGAGHSSGRSRRRRHPHEAARTGQASG